MVNGGNIIITQIIWMPEPKFPWPPQPHNQRTKPVLSSKVLIIPIWTNQIMIIDIIRPVVIAIVTLTVVASIWPRVIPPTMTTTPVLSSNLTPLSSQQSQTNLNQTGGSEGMTAVSQPDLLSDHARVSQHNTR